MSGNQALLWLVAENHAADRVYANNLGAKFVVRYILADSAQGAAGAGRREYVINLGIEAGYNLSHCSIMRLRIVLVRILIDPDAVRNFSAQLLHSVNARRQQITGHRIRNVNQFDVHAISPKYGKVGRRGAGIDYANEPQSKISAYLRQPYSKISGTGFNNCGIRPDLTRLVGIKHGADGYAVLTTATRV